jgi:WD40-like Beta Propeller Repeat
VNRVRSRIERRRSSPLAAALILGALACSADGDGGASPTAGGPRLPSTQGSGAANDLLAGEGGTSAVFADPVAPGPAGISSYTDDAHTQPARRVDCADSNQLAAFRAAAPGNSLRLAYPYDGTVWPRGLLPPVLQWDGAGGDAIYLRIQSRGYVFEGCFAGAGAPARFSIPEDAWIGAGEWSLGAADPTSVTLAVRTGGSITATSQQWSFALANIKGAIYYNTYGSPKALRQTPPAAGAVLKIVPGQAEPQVFLSIPGIPPVGPCVSCHSLSSDGSTMTANNHAYPFGPFLSQSYDVSTGAPSMLQSNLPESGFAGIYPDGSFLVTNGPPSPSTDNPSFPMGANNVPALVGPAESNLVDTRTGSVLGRGPALHAQMPTFSPDGRSVVYNSFDDAGGHGIYVSDFDSVTKTFSNKREVYRDSVRYPGWPFVTPDGKAVIYVLGTRSDFVSQLPAGLVPPPLGNAGRSNLRITYLDALGQSIPLDAANGSSGGQVYLPAGAARDSDLEFFPTVSPIAAGGYFWIFFTSRRTYGNISTVGLEDPLSKKIWVTAIDIGAPPGTDPSHPAFFLPGQELGSGNVRAFAALEPCKDDSSGCTSGTDCCSGFCTDNVCGPPRECSGIDERCVTRDDCCNPNPDIQCIAGFCATARVIR